MKKSAFGFAYVNPTEDLLSAAKEWCRNQKTSKWFYNFSSFIEESFNPSALPAYYPELAVLKVIVLWKDSGRMGPTVKVKVPLFLAIDYDEDNKPFVASALYHPSEWAYRLEWKGRHVSLPIPEGKYMVNSMHSPYGECDIKIAHTSGGLYLAEPVSADMPMPVGYGEMQFKYEERVYGDPSWRRRNTPILE